MLFSGSVVCLPLGEEGRSFSPHTHDGLCEAHLLSTACPFWSPAPEPGFIKCILQPEKEEMKAGDESCLYSCYSEMNTVNTLCRSFQLYFAIAEPLGKLVFPHCLHFLLSSSSICRDTAGASSPPSRARSKITPLSHVQWILCLLELSEVLKFTPQATQLT